MITGATMAFKVATSFDYLPVPSQTLYQKSARRSTDGEGLCESFEELI
jgi:hypothetical protein